MTDKPHACKDCGSDIVAADGLCPRCERKPQPYVLALYEGVVAELGTQVKRVELSLTAGQLQEIKEFMDDAQDYVKWAVEPEDDRDEDEHRRKKR